MQEEMQEIGVRFLGWEDSLEEEMATHSSILAWRIPWKEEPGGLQSTGLQSQTQLKWLSLQAHMTYHEAKYRPLVKDRR